MTSNCSACIRGTIKHHNIVIQLKRQAVILYGNKDRERGRERGSERRLSSGHQRRPCAVLASFLATLSSKTFAITCLNTLTHSHAHSHTRHTHATHTHTHLPRTLQQHINSTHASQRNLIKLTSFSLCFALAQLSLMYARPTSVGSIWLDGPARGRGWGWLFSRWCCAATSCCASSYIGNATK